MQVPVFIVIPRTGINHAFRIPDFAKTTGKEQPVKSRLMSVLSMFGSVAFRSEAPEGSERKARGWQRDAVRAPGGAPSNPRAL